VAFCLWLLQTGFVFLSFFFRRVYVENLEFLPKRGLSLFEIFSVKPVIVREGIRFRPIEFLRVSSVAAYASAKLWRRSRK